MARYYDTEAELRFVALDLSEQLRPGTFEHALNYLIDHELDVSHFDARYRNDDTGAPAYPPAMLLKVVLFAYSQGLLSSRRMAQACARDVTFMALSGDSQPHFTTIAHFVSTLDGDIASVFGAVLAICQRQGLIGGEMFAIDGVKLPSNASKHKSGTRADFERQAGKLEATAKALLARHQTADSKAMEDDTPHTVQKIERLRRDARELRDWLAANPHDRRGASGKVVKSNRTDNDSAKMATDKGVIQGYTGVAAVDAKHQIIIAAQAHGTGSEQSLLIPTVAAAAPYRHVKTLITADSGYYSKDNLIALDALNVNALIADNQIRKRDERFDEQVRHKTKPKPLYDKSGKPKNTPRYTPADFIHDPIAGTCVCPAGKSLYRHGAHCRISGREAMRFEGAKRDCMPCTQRDRCLRSPDKTPARQVAFFNDNNPILANRLAALMRERIDSDTGREQYGHRFAAVEPVFGNLRHNKRLSRFTLRSQRKVNAQWMLFSLVHNIEKLANVVYAN